MQSLTKIAKLIVFLAGIMYFGFIIFGPAIFEKNWTTFFGIMALGALFGIGFITRYLWRKFVVNHTALKRAAGQIDGFLGEKFVKPLEMSFRTESGFQLPDSNQPLLFSDISNVDLQKYDRALENLRKQINNYYFVGLAPICFLLLIMVPLIIIPKLEDFHELIGSVLLFLMIVSIGAMAIIFRVILLLNNFFDYLKSIRLELEVGNELLSKEERDAAKKELESLIIDIQKHRIDLTKLRKDIQQVESLSLTAKDSFLNVMRATLDATIQPQTDSVKNDLINYHKKTGQIESKRSLIQDILLGVLFLVAGLIIGQMPEINNWISDLLQTFGLAQK